MPKGIEIVHGAFKLNFRSTKAGLVEFRMDNSLLTPFGDGYLSTEDFHKLRGIVNHGFNHLNKHYNVPRTSGAGWTVPCIKVGSILKCTKTGDSGVLTLGKLYTVAEVSELGSFMCADDKGVINYALSNVTLGHGVIQY